MKRIILLMLSLFSISSTAYGYYSPAISGPQEALVKKVFIEQAQKKDSAIRKSLNTIYALERETIIDENVAVVPKSLFQYTGKENSDGSVSEDEFSATYFVFVAYMNGGRGAIGGTVQFTCKLAYKGDEYSAKDVKCSSEFIMHGND